MYSETQPQCFQIIQRKKKKIMEKCVMYICIPCPSTCTYHYNIVCHYKLASFAVLGPGVFDLHK